MNLSKRLISLNMALVMAISFFAVSPIKANADATPASYLAVDGTTYDATEQQTGANWSYTIQNDRGFPDPVLTLRDYTRGSIKTNLDHLTIRYEGINTITARDGEYGIQSDNIVMVCFSYIENDDPNPSLPMLTVTGAEGKAAVKARVLRYGSFITFQGGAGASALDAEEVEYLDDTYFMHITSTCLVGSSASTATAGDYTGQAYLSYSLAPHLLTLEGNGGTTAGGQDSYIVRRYYVTNGSLKLYDYADTFTKAGSTLLGWTETRNGKNKIWSVNEDYQFDRDSAAGTVSALWDDASVKGVILKGFYGTYKDYVDYNYHFLLENETIVERVDKGDTFTLPEPQRGGYAFTGWKDEGGVTHEAGEILTITSSQTFTAQYEAKTIKIGGQTLDATQNQGSKSSGYQYIPSASGSSEKIYPVQLDIYSNYSGEPIELQTSALIHLHGSVTGGDSPAITVAGDAGIYVTDFSREGGATSFTLRGASGYPAVRATGDVFINVIDDNEATFIGGGVAAISSVGFSTDNKVVSVGPDEDHLIDAADYNGETCLKMTMRWDYTIDVSGVVTLPSAPVNSESIFLGWTESKFESGNFNDVWYKAGDTIDAGGGMVLFANYLKKDGVTAALLIDGNGAETSNGSKYFVKMASPVDLSTYQFTAPANPFVSQQPLAEFNTAQDGSGISYVVGEKIPARGALTTLYAKWGVATYFVTGSFDNNGKLVATISAPKGSVLIAAAYDSDGRMVDTKSFDVTTAMNNGAHTFDDLSTNENYTYKIMLVDQETYEPICAAWGNTRLTVSNGTGSGEYAAEATVTITANAAPAGQVFYMWTSEEAIFANASSATTTITMPTKNTTVTATYRSVPNPTPIPSSRDDYTPSIPSTPSSTTTTTSNPDGSTTRTTTRADGSKTEVTTAQDGSTTTVNTERDGSATITQKAADGSTSTTKTDTQGNAVSAEVAPSAKAISDAAEKDEAVTLPVKVKAANDAASAAPVEITMPETVSEKNPVTVEIPVENLTPGTVAVIMNEDGTEKIVKTSTIGENGVVLMLNGSATVKIVDNTKTFNDVSGSEWYANNVAWAASHEVMNGVGNGNFDANATTTSGMVAQILMNLAGGNANPDAAAASFNDVDAADWFASAISWVTETGIAQGEGESFGAMEAISRERDIVMVYHFAQYMGYDTSAHADLSAFSDASSVSKWAQEAMEWAVAVGLINGTKDAKGDIVLDAQGNATRAQIAAITQRFCEKVIK